MTNRIPPMMIAAGAVAYGSVMDAIIKHLAVETPVMQVVAWRYILGAAFTLSLVAIRRKPLPNLAGIRFHTLRGLIVGATGICFFYTLTQLALSEATVLIFAAALMIAPVARILLKEKISAFTAIATLIGFAGIAIATLTGETMGAPPEGNRLMGLVIGLMSSVLYAIGVVMLRKRTGQEDSITIVAFSNTIPAILLLPFAFAMPMQELRAMLTLLGIASLLGVGIWWLMTLAYARAPAQKLAPIEYTALIWATILGWTMFNERPHWTLYAGAVVVILACLAVAFETRFTTRREAKTPASDIVH
ncbi:MAG: hypothetical protein CME88_14520 [Hirschia sp.]|nr:hypothetical protein [Hirschia sp.]